MKRDKSDIFDALSNPVRREIIILLGEHGSLRAKQLKEFLNIGPGQLYYHLNMLSKLVTQNENREYVLTEMGREVYRAIARGEPPQPPDLSTSYSVNPLIRMISYALFPKFVFNYIFESPVRHVVEALLIVVVGGYISFESGYLTLLLIPTESASTILYSYISFIVTVASIYLLTELFSIILFRRLGGHLKLFIGTIFSFSPIILFYVLIYVDRVAGLGLLNIFSGWLVRLFMILCQIFTITLLASCISVAKKLGIDRAAFISLLIAYLSIVLYLLS